MANKFTKKQLQTLNQIADKIGFSFMISEEDKNEPCVSFGPSSVSFSGTGDGINDAPVIDTVQLNKYDIADYLENPAACLTELLSKYFIEK